MNAEKQCRICLGSEGDLMKACGCKGSIEYMHRELIETENVKSAISQTAYSNIRFMN